MAVLYLNANLAIILIEVMALPSAIVLINVINKSFANLYVFRKERYSEMSSDLDIWIKINLRCFFSVLGKMVQGNYACCSKWVSIHGTFWNQAHLGAEKSSTGRLWKLFL